jgi:hypothetical protein
MAIKMSGLVKSVLSFLWQGIVLYCQPHRCCHCGKMIDASNPDYGVKTIGLTYCPFCEKMSI